MTGLRDLSPLSTLSTLARWTAIIGGTTVVTLLAGVGLAAILSRSGAPADWSKWSDVGQTFGVLSSIFSGLALAAVTITARVELREIKRRGASEAGNFHLEILKLSINDAELAAVWPELKPDLTPTRNRQFLYANLIYQFHLRLLQEKSAEAEVLGSLRYLFTSPLMREYWAAAERGRSFLEPGSPEQLLTSKVDEICRLAGGPKPFEGPSPAGARDPRNGEGKETVT